MTLPCVMFLGVPLVRVTTSQFIDWVLECAAKSVNQKPKLVSYLNAHCSNVAECDARYCEILRNADAVYADGQAIVWATRYLGAPVPERVNAADFIISFLQQVADRQMSVYFLGSAPGVAAKAAERFRVEVPTLNVVGTCDGFFTDSDASVAEINNANPDLLLVGMGVPRQEEWANDNLYRLNAKMVWCVGALFEYYGEARARAPVWMRHAGLEWLFRLALEPGRMWRRYLLGNVRFVLRVLRARAVTKAT